MGLLRLLPLTLSLFHLLLHHSSARTKLSSGFWDQKNLSDTIVTHITKGHSPVEGTPRFPDLGVVGDSADGSLRKETPFMGYLTKEQFQNQKTGKPEKIKEQTTTTSSDPEKSTLRRSKRNKEKTTSAISSEKKSEVNKEQKKEPLQTLEEGEEENQQSSSRTLITGEPLVTSPVSESPVSETSPALASTTTVAKVDRLKAEKDKEEVAEEKDKEEGQNEQNKGVSNKKSKTSLLIDTTSKITANKHEISPDIKSSNTIHSSNSKPIIVSRKRSKQPSDASDSSYYNYLPPQNENDEENF